MLSQLARYYHTLRYLQWIQIKYRLLQPWKRLWLRSKAVVIISAKRPPLTLAPSIPSHSLWQGENTFSFLNISHQFDTTIDWNCADHGKLWTYNLTYFEYLAQADLPKETGLQLIHDFIDQASTIKDGMEPYPISLRLIFWIKYLARHQISNDRIDQSLLQQLKRLSQLPEYHLLGNHLLENGFSLLFGAIFFSNDSYLQQAQNILIPQLAEQVLPDGGHFERSPMYQQILLFRLLDSINLLQHNPSSATQELLELLCRKATLMLAWLHAISFSGGATPRLNDSAPGIAPHTKALQSYAQRLNLPLQEISLQESGYRKFSNANYEAIIDVGAIGPDYIPGHAHSDTFNIVLHHRGMPMLVDTGISTYEKNATRKRERSTAAHNTVQIAGEEQSEVWGGFRVARRAKIIDLQESEQAVKATHNGYLRIGCIHQREFLFAAQTIVLKDTIVGGKTGAAHFHFHPEQRIVLQEQGIKGDFGILEFTNAHTIRLQNYSYALGFNQITTAQKAVVTFSKTLQTKINLS